MSREQCQKLKQHLSPLHFLGRHDDDAGVLLEDHPPKVGDGVLQAALCGDVALLHLSVVAFSIQLRLSEENTEKKRKRITYHVTT